jgi:hypothetical protein
MKINAVGIDLAKNVFQIHGVDERGRVLLRKQVKRAQVASFFGGCTNCSNGETRTSLPWRSPTGMRGLPGRCSPMNGNSKLTTLQLFKLKGSTERPIAQAIRK